jgi:hypothetical protein
MESVLVCFVSLALIIVSTVTMTMNTVNSAAKLADSWKTMQEKTNNIRRTEIVTFPPEDYVGGTLELVVKNEGQVNISDFSQWDVIIEGQGGSANYLTYSPIYPPGDNQWAVEGIYISDNLPEVFDLNIFNPGEQVVLGINYSGILGVGQTIKITLSTSDGVTSQCYVTMQAAPLPP